jgi:hypothetical protein
MYSDNLSVLDFAEPVSRLQNPHNPIAKYCIQIDPDCHQQSLYLYQQKT